MNLKKYSTMKFINDFALLRSKKGDGVVYALEYAAVAAAGPVLASCAPGPSEFNRPVL